MKLQGNKMMKTNFKRLAILTMVCAATVGLTACGGGGGSSSSPDQPSTGSISIKVEQQTPSKVSIQVRNSDQVNTGSIFYSFFSDNNYQIYDGSSTNSFCSPEQCFNTCVDGQFLQPGQVCYIYVNAKNTLDYIDNPIDLTNVITITNVSSVYKFNLNLKGSLYALTDNNQIFERKHGESNWAMQQTLLPTNVTASTLGIDNNSVLFIGDQSNGDIYSQSQFPSIVWRNWGKAISAVNNINAIAFDSNNMPYVGGTGSNDIYKFSNGQWISDGSPDSVITAIKHIGFYGNNNMAVQGDLPSTPSFYLKQSGAWSNIGMPTGTTNAVLGFSVESGGKIHTSLATMGNTYSYINSWSAGDGNVVDGSTEVNALSSDRANNLYAGAANNVYQKLSGGTWTDLGSPDGRKIKQIVEGTRLTVTQVQ